MVDKKLHCTYFPAIAGRFVEKDSLKHNVSKLSSSQKSLIYIFSEKIINAILYFYWALAKEMNIISLPYLDS